MSGEPVFSPRLLTGWIAAAVIVFALSLYFMLGGQGNKPGVDAVGPSTFSRSAIGYAGLAELLQRLGVTVVKSQYDAPAKLGPGGVLVIAEPPLTVAAGMTAGASLEAPTVLLILPKWQGRASDSHRGWVGSAELKSLFEANWALRLVVQKGEVVRLPEVASWSTNALNRIPAPATPVQLIHSDRLRPIVASDDGILVGELIDKKRRFWVLADPDVMANHGLARDGNAEFAVALINALRHRGGGKVVFDETIHGYVARPSNPFRLLFEFPFVFATVQGVLAVLLLLWATIGRFGAPEAAPPALLAGKQGLIHNAARLLAFAGYQKTIVRRYVLATIRDAARHLHAPRGLSDQDLVDWLDRVGQARAVTVDCAALYREVEAMGEGRGGGDAARLSPVARAIHQWKREIIDGPPANSRRRRSGADRSRQGRRRAG